MTNNYTAPDEGVTTTKFCRICGEKLKYDKKFDKTEYDEMNGEQLDYKYSVCPNIEDRFDDNHMPTAHSQTYKIKRVKND